MTIDEALAIADECTSGTKYGVALRFLAAHAREKKETQEVARSVLPRSNGVEWKQRLIERYEAGEKLELAQLDAIGVKQ